MPYTSLYKLSVQTAASNSGVWGAGGTSGDDLNTGVMQILDSRLAGIQPFSVGASNVSLSYTQIQTRCLRFTGTLTANIVVSPAVGDATTYFNGPYFFENLTTGSFTITLTTATGSVVLPQSRRGIVFLDSTNAPRIFAIVASANLDPIPSGTVMLFYQNAAPTGWTIFSGLNDYALKIVPSAGGVTSGSVAYSTLFGRTATDTYTLQTADVPAHTHFGFAPVVVTNSSVAANQLTANQQVASVTNSGGGDFSATLNPTNTAASVGLTSSVGGGGAHSHNIDMRVLTASVILATKN